MANVLIVDDDKMMAETLHDMVAKLGHQVILSHRLTDGLCAAKASAVDVVFLDVLLPDGNGVEALPSFRAVPSLPEVIIITAFGSKNNAELAIKNQAWDYIEKPFSMEMIHLSLTRVLQYREAQRQAKPPMVLDRLGIIGSSPQMTYCMEQVAQAAAGEGSVLITGETGTGKELIARAIHANSGRAKANFVTVDCASLPPTIVASALFGHVKGAFTSADNHHEGLIAQADRGTLFLDEVGELPLSVQKTFLRVLQEHRFRPVGGSREMKSDFRVIAATNRDIQGMVSLGHFRRDLFFRLHVFSVSVPPLRQRTGDLKELLTHYLGYFCEQYGVNVKGFSPEFLAVLMSYDWPGNVRELVNVIEVTLAAAQHEPVLFPKHLPPEIRIKTVKFSDSKTTDRPETDLDSGIFEASMDFHTYRREAERKYLLDLMKVYGHCMKDASRISGLSRSRLHALMKLHNISRFS